MKACGHNNESVQGCDTCYIVKLKKRVDRLLENEYKRLDRIKELENLLKAARDFIADEHIRRDIDTALLGGGE